MRLATVLFVLGLLKIARSQVQDNEPPNSCNVVCNCNRDKWNDVQSTRPIASQGSQGKRGPAGERGEAGFKGEKVSSNLTYI